MWIFLTTKKMSDIFNGDPQVFIGDPKEKGAVIRTHITFFVLIYTFLLGTSEQ